MITILSKSSLYTDALCEALSEFRAVAYRENKDFGDILIILDQEKADEFLKNEIPSSVILIGCKHKNADIELSIPLSIHELKLCINTLINKKKTAPSFENKRFLFEGATRHLFDKKLKKDYYLTEKETDLISYLVRVYPEGATKIDLLTEVWKYSANTETHTVESHVYGLRQKIGESAADFLFKNTNDGYVLIDF